MKIDATDPNNLSEKVLNERETRKRLLTHAKMNGVEGEVLQLFAKFDKMLKNCNNDRERNDMAKLAVTQIYLAIGGGGTLTIDGKIVIKQD